MTGAEAAAVIQRKLGFRSDQLANIILELDEAQKLLERGKTLPKFLIEEDDTLTFAASDNEENLPTGFLKMVDDDLPYYTNADNTVTYLDQTSWDQMQRLYASSDEGPPKAFALRKATMIVAPTPAASTTITFSYYKRGDDITSGVETTWLAEDAAPYLVIAVAGMRMAASLHAERALQEFTRMAQDWRTAIFYETVEQETAGPIVMGSNL